MMNDTHVHNLRRLIDQNPTIDREKILSRFANTYGLSNSAVRRIYAGITSKHPLTADFIDIYRTARSRNENIWN